MEFILTGIMYNLVSLVIMAVFMIAVMLIIGDEKTKEIKDFVDENSKNDGMEKFLTILLPFYTTSKIVIFFYDFAFKVRGSLFERILSITKRDITVRKIEDEY